MTRADAMRLAFALPVLLAACSRDGSKDIARDTSRDDASARDTAAKLPGPRDDAPGKVPTGGRCTRDAECGGGDHCMADNPDPPCGVVPVARCRRDDECPAGQVCAPVGTCHAAVCAPRCSGCRPQDACNDAGHCSIRACAGDADCPPDFACEPVGTGGECRVKTCTRDDQCRGVCLNGYCSATGGRCGKYMAKP